MTKNINTNTEARTIAVVLEEIKANISEFNLSEDNTQKNELEVALKELETEYNKLSLLNSWATFIKDENPMVAFAKAYTYPCVGHTDRPHSEIIDGVKKTVRTRVLDVEKERLLNVADFLAWTEERGQCVALDLKWRTKVEEARQTMITAWKKFRAAKSDKTQINVGQMKDALQEMINALVFVEGAKGGNAIVVKSSLVRDIFSVANTRKDGLQIGTLNKSTWAKLQMDILYAAVGNKDFTVIYGDEKPEDDDSTEDSTDETASK